MERLVLYLSTETIRVSNNIWWERKNSPKTFDTTKIPLNVSTEIDSFY